MAEQAPKLAVSVQRRMFTRSLTPVIVETEPGEFPHVMDWLVSVATGGETLLPAIIGKAFVNMKAVPSLNLIEVPLSPNLISELSESTSVRRVMRSTTHYAFGFGMYQWNGKPYTTINDTRNWLGVQEADNAGLTGKGVKVAVIDTGARPTHQQLRGIQVYSTIREKGGLGVDSNGHGTWCCSCIGGKTAQDPVLKKQVIGIAPGVTLMSIQALGFGIGMGTTGDIIQALELARSLKADIVSMSLGSEDAVPQVDDPEAQAVNRMAAEGILMVIAAGNSGPNAGSINSPGSAEGGLTVGALDVADLTTAPFSSRGPTPDGTVKPDVLNPGAAGVANGGLGILSGSAGLLDAMTDKVRQGFAPMQGTSMATPHVAGLLALGVEHARRRGRALRMDSIKAVMRAKSGNQKSMVSGWGTLMWEDVRRAAEL